MAHTAIMHHRGHFCVCDSLWGPCKWGIRRMALIELTDPTKLPSRIDRRERAIKKIVVFVDQMPTHNRRAWFRYMDERKRLIAMAEKFDNLWPAHCLAKEWPHPMPMWVEQPPHLNMPPIKVE